MVKFKDNWVHRLRNILSVAFYCIGTLIILAASILISPRWAAFAALAYIVVFRLLSLKALKNHYENNLVKHPDVHQFSPNLGKIVTELYEVSGLDAKSNPIYDFRVESKTPGVKKGRLARIYEVIGNLTARTHNAAATDMGKPVIMISEPLLKLLDEPEEKAVLAHEFAHVVDHDPGIKLFQGFMAGIARATNGFNMLRALWMTGWRGFLCVVVVFIFCLRLIKHFYPDALLILKKKRALMGVLDRVREEKIKQAYRVLYMAVSAPILTYFYHKYLLLLVMTRCLSTTASLLTSALSRSREYQADRGAIVLGADPLALITGLRKIFILQERAKDKAFEGKAPKGNPLMKKWHQLFASHPSFHDRVARLAAIARKQGFSESDIQQATVGHIELSTDHDIPDDIIKMMARNLARDL